MSFSEKARGLYTEPETSPGTWADPLDRIAGFVNPVKMNVRIRNLDFSIDPQLDDENSYYLNGGYGGDESIVGNINGSVKFGIKLAPGVFEKDPADTANVHQLAYIDYLKSSGLVYSEITDGTTVPADYSYGLSHVFYPSVTKSAYTLSETVVDKDSDGSGTAYDLIGLVQKLTINAEGTGKPFMMNFEGAGGVESVTEISAADMKKIAFDSDDVMESVAIKFNKTKIKITDLTDTTITPFEVCVSKLDFDAGNQTTDIECQATESGLLYSAITDQQPRLTFNPELKKLSEFDWFKGLKQAHKYKIEISKIATDRFGDDFTALQLIIPYAQMISAPISATDGFMRQDITFRPLGNKPKTIPEITVKADATGTESQLPIPIPAEDIFGAMWYLVVGEEHTK